jgi:hypothetical protein
MRFGSGLGLLSLLITMVIILMLFAGRGCGGQSYLGLLARTKKEKEPLVQQWGGKDVRGRPFWESLDLEGWPDTGSVKGLEVTRVDPFGPAATHFGLQTGDIIVEIGLHEVGGPIVDTPVAGGEFLTEAFARNFPIKVRRGEQVLTLPSGKPPAPGTGAFPQANPSQTPAGLPPVPGIPPGP